MRHNLDSEIQISLKQINFDSTDITPQQIELINQIAKSEPNGLHILAEILFERTNNAFLSPMDGVIYEKLSQATQPETQNFLKTHFASGIVPLKSEKNINYSELQHLLQNKKFLEADILTNKKLCELAGVSNTRDWLYFTDIYNFPTSDLQTIDTLWRIHSHNRFGFSIQKQIWDTVHKNREKLFHKIQWIINNNLCRYPNDFIWDLSAPKGHLPLLNQLRGTQVLIFLLSHKAWQSN
mmetsp:Transcript_16938/g.69132  ORF Transcript_16938/g.69132 Transcript_16938/m.69132 type:complete len:238 (+) Transcript_16938:3893-4606(+)